MNWERYLDPIEGRVRFRRERLRLRDGRTLGEAMDTTDQWQKVPLELFDHPDTRVLFLVGARGVGKSTLCAALSTEWITLESDVDAVVLAADIDQARIVLEEAAAFVKRDEMLSGVLELYRDRIENPTSGSRLRVLTSDAPSNFGLGLRRTQYVYDEVHTAVSPDLLHAVLSSLHKSRGSKLLCPSNAGHKPSPAWDLFRQCKAGDDPALKYWDSVEAGARPSWLDPADLERQRRLLPLTVYNRLHRNVWSQGSGELLLPEEIERCIDERIDPTSLVFDSSRKHFLGLDLALRKDRAVLVIGRKDGETLRLVHVKTWFGSHENQISLEDVSVYLMDVCRRIPHLKRGLVDEWQAALLVERARRAGLRSLETLPFTTVNVAEMSSAIFNSFRSKRIQIPRHPHLIDELQNARVIQKGNSPLWRLDHASDNFSDHIFATALCLLASTGDHGEIVAEDKRLNFVIEHFRARVLSPTEFGFPPRRGLQVVSPNGGDSLPPRDVYAEVRLLQLLHRTGRLSKPEAEVLERRIRERAQHHPHPHYTDALDSELGSVNDFLENRSMQ